MENLVKSRTVEQAIEWLEKMNIEVEHTGPTNMYEFEYKGDIMLINADAPEGVLFITSPIYIPSESEQECRTLFTKALDITEDDLSDYVVEFVKNNLAYIAQAYALPERSNILRKYQLVTMLDDLAAKANNLRSAVMILSIPFEEMVAEFDKKHLPN